MTDNVTEFPKAAQGQVVSIQQEQGVSEETMALMIEHLESVIDRVRAGEVTGFAMAHLHRDNLSSYTLMGAIGGFSMLGAVDMIHHELTSIHGSGG